MPTRAKRVRLARPRRRDTRRATSAQRGYDAKWQAARLRFLDRPMTIEYRVVWRDRYWHASATTSTLEGAEEFQRMLKGVACQTAVQHRQAGQAAWRCQGRLYADLVHEQRGALELMGSEYAGSDAAAHHAVQEAIRQSLLETTP